MDSCFSLHTLEIENCNTNISKAEYVIYRIKKENLSDDEYKKEYYSNKEYDIKIYEKLENENKEKKIKNENKLLMYENMMKILSIL